MNKKNAIVCDLDGTAAINNGHRSFYDERKCYGDDVNKPVSIVVHAIMMGLNTAENLIYVDKYEPIELLFVSGRKDYARGESNRWIRDKFMSGTSAHYQLFMRKSDDNRDDCIVKEEIYREHIEPYYNVLVWLDDRSKVVKHMRSLGLTVFQVANGDF